MSEVARRGSRDEVTIEGARIIFRNFVGEQKQYNAAGNRNFCVVLNEEQADELLRQGFNVKIKEAKPEYQEEGGDNFFRYLKINVKFGGRPPGIWFISNQGTQKTRLPEKLMRLVDLAAYENIDFTFSRYERKWDDGRTTVTAYLQSFWGTLREDPLEIKYRDIEDVSVERTELEREQMKQLGGERLALPAGSPEEDDYINYDYDGTPED